VGMILSFFLLLIKLALVLLVALFINRFFKFESEYLNQAEKAMGQGVDWLRERHLNLKANLEALATLLALIIFVNWYAELEYKFITSMGEGLLDFVRHESWSNVIPVLDSITRLLVYLLVLIALNRFLKLQVQALTRIDKWLYDFMDRLILSHGGLFELVSKTVMTLIVAMIVNYHAQIGFIPLNWLQDKTVATLGLEGLGEGSAARRAHKRCLKEMETFKMSQSLMTNAMITAEADGRSEAAIAFRDKLDNLKERVQACEQMQGI